MMRDTIQSVHAKIVSTRYGNPARGLSVILVAGERGKSTTAKFLEAILKEAGRRTVRLSGSYDTSIQSFYDSVSKTKKEQPALIIIEVTERLLATGALKGVSIDTLIVTEANKHAYSLMNFGPKHVVAPVGFSVPDGSVEPYQQISYGEAEAADARVDSIKLYRQGTEVSLTIDHQTKLEIATYYTGFAAATDLVAAVAAAYVLAVPHDSVQEGVADLEPPIGDCTWLQTNRPYEIVYDTASTVTGVEFAVKSVKSLVKRRLIILLDRSYESDVLTDLYSQADRVIVVARDEPNTSVEVEPTHTEAFEKALRGAKRDDTVLVVGNGFGANIADIDSTTEKADDAA